VAASKVRRLSLVFFHHPNYDAEVACIPTCADTANPPRYPPVKAGAIAATSTRKRTSPTAA
jgi:isopenicillin N synthase-like dioxygenase